MEPEGSIEGQGHGVAMTVWKKMWSTPGKDREFLGWPAIVFILTQLVFGLPLLPYALYHWHSVDPLRFASFLAVALAASLFKVRLPGIHATMSANFLFILVGILDLSYPETLLMGCLGGLVQSLWYAAPRPRPIQLAFNLANLRSEEHTSELQSRLHLVCRLLLEKKKKQTQLQSRSNLRSPNLIQRETSLACVQQTKVRPLPRLDMIA